MARTAQILVVEDDATNREILGALLREMGHVPILAGSGPEAIAFLESPIDLDIVITDVVMPEMNGIEFARQAHLARPGVAVVFITGDTGAMQSVVEAGSFALLKPYESRRLEHIIDEVMAERSR